MNTLSERSTLSAEDGLRNALVNNTVRYAARDSRFYGQLYAGIDLDDVRSIDDLVRLPITYKAQFRAAGEDIMCAGLTCTHVQNTTGSTGDLMIMFRSAEETEFIQDFYGRIIEEDEPIIPMPLAMSLGTMLHGTPTAIPSRFFVLTHAIIDGESARQTLRLLERRFRIPGVAERVSILTGSLSQILVLTEYMLDHGISRSEYGITTLCITGRYLTRRFRRLLEHTWGATVVDRFSLSEVFGGGAYCELFDGYHFDPCIVAEVVDLRDNTPLMEGTGALLLSGLHPFVQLHPIIRYWTGDLFNVSESPCGVRRYRFLGRLNHALVHPTCHHQVLLNGVDLWETLDQYPDVRRTDRGQTLTNLHVPIVRGEVRMIEGMIVARLTIEMTVHPTLFPDRVRSLADAITNELRTRSSALDAAIKGDELQFQVQLVPPGTLQPLDLQPFEKKTPLWEIVG